ncbi:MAG: MgtC/SapB family protein [Deltaproteobacteria bacterium]|nr:MgtC/SapB family protein [Candidatus Anaeroferrophillus wilburensis]MBN2887747.1 MgtC/SapB family protein [Deltaproteobacteria bacterium]
MVPVDFLDPGSVAFWTRIGMALVCGAIVGFERQLRGKPAGIRTCILICLGTCVFVGLSACYPDQDIDPTRVVGQIVTGVGFLGAGVIIAKEGAVTGVTTAAIIWMLAGVGATIGVGRLQAALSVTIVTVAVLLGVEFLETTFRRLRRGVHARRPLAKDEHHGQTDGTNRQQLMIDGDRFS